MNPTKHEPANRNHPAIGADSGHLEHRAERSRRILLSILVSALTRPLSVVVTIVTVPLFVHYLGIEGFGLFEALAAVAVWLTQANLGMGLGLMNRLTDCNVGGDRELARRYVSSVVVAEVVLALAGAAAAVALVPLVNWQHLFPVQDPKLAAQLPRAALVVCISMVIGSMLDTPTSIYTAYQEVYRASLWDGALRLVVLAASFCVVRTRLGLLGVVIAMNVVPVAFRALNLAWVTAVEKPWLRPSLRLFEWRLLRATLSQGFVLFLLTASVLAIYQTDKLIIGSVLGAAQVTGYALVGRVFLIAYTVLMLILAPLWPAHGEAIRRGDNQWVHDAVRRSLIAGFGIMLACGIGMLVLGDRVLQVWTRGAPVTVSKSLIAAMTAMFLLRAWVDCRSVALNSAEVLVPQLWLVVSHAVLNLAIAIPMGRRFGVEGVAWSAPITGIVTAGWGYPLLLRRTLSSKMRLRQGGAGQGETGALLPLDQATVP